MIWIFEGNRYWCAICVFKIWVVFKSSWAHVTIMTVQTGICNCSVQLDSFWQCSLFLRYTDYHVSIEDCNICFIGHIYIHNKSLPSLVLLFFLIVQFSKSVSSYALVPFFIFVGKLMIYVKILNIIYPLWVVICCDWQSLELYM